MLQIKVKSQKMVGVPKTKHAVNCLENNFEWFHFLFDEFIYLCVCECLMLVIL